MVEPNNQMLYVQFINKDILYKFLGGLLGKLFGKGDDNQVVNSEFLKKFLFLFERVDELDAVILFKHKAGMRPKGNNYAFSIDFMSHFEDAA
jgi:hypothetical protein